MCMSCKAKIEKNIPFEKGVKDLKVNQSEQEVTIQYRTDKTTEETLIKALKNLGVKIIDPEEKETAEPVKEGNS